MDFRLTKEDLSIVRQCPTTSWKTVRIPGGKFGYDELADGKINYKSGANWVNMEYKLVSSSMYNTIQTSNSLSDHYIPYASSHIAFAIKHIARNCIKGLFRIGLTDKDSTLSKLSKNKIFDKYLAREIYSFM